MARTDGLLCSAVDKGLDRVTINFHIDTRQEKVETNQWDVYVFEEVRCGLEHDDAPKAFWREFHSVLQVLHDGLHTNSLFNFALRFDIIRICVESFDFSLTCAFRFVISFSLLAEK